MIKPIKIETVTIVVSTNGDMHKGWLAMISITGILPGRRDMKALMISPSSGYVWVHPLNGYAGEAKISPNDWRRVMNRAKVVSDPHSPVEITPEIEAAALDKYKKDYLESIAGKLDECNRDRNSRNISDLVTEFNPVEFI